MSQRSIWYVDTPDATTLTVIAASHGDALDLAIEFCDDDESSRSDYSATGATDDAFRWVGFEAPSDAKMQVRDLDAVGVPLDRVRTRTTSRPGIGEVLWEVGTLDEHWRQLPAGILGGGGP